jgi:hypothetical protein
MFLDMMLGRSFLSGSIAPGVGLGVLGTAWVFGCFFY